MQHSVSWITKTHLLILCFTSFLKNTPEEISPDERNEKEVAPETFAFPIIYAWFREKFMNGSSDPVYGHIMCNEMKLWSDLFYWYPKNRKCVGIIVKGDKDRISLANKLAKLYKGGSKKEAEGAKDSTYSILLSVNQGSL